MDGRLGYPSAIRPVAQPDEDFIAVPDSSYRLADGQTGTYLRLGTEVVMTSGPRDGVRYRLQSEATMRKLDASGKETPLRCVRAGDPAANLVDRNDPAGDEAAH